MPIEVKGSAPLLQVFDMPTSIAFYCDKLGFKLVQRSQPDQKHFDWAMLQLGDEQLMLNTAYEQHERPPAPHRRASIRVGQAEIPQIGGTRSVASDSPMRSRRSVTLQLALRQSSESKWGSSVGQASSLSLD